MKCQPEGPRHAPGAAKCGMPGREDALLEEMEIELDRHGAIERHGPSSWRNVSAFWSLGLLNNSCEFVLAVCSGLFGPALPWLAPRWRVTRPSPPTQPT